MPSLMESALRVAADMINAFDGEIISVTEQSDEVATKEEAREDMWRILAEVEIHCRSRRCRKKSEYSFDLRDIDDRQNYRETIERPHCEHCKGTNVGVHVIEHDVFEEKGNEAKAAPKPKLRESVLPEKDQGGKKKVAKDGTRVSGRISQTGTVERSLPQTIEERVVSLRKREEVEKMLRGLLAANQVR